MECQCAVEPRDVLRDRRGLVRGQPVQEHMQGPPTSTHHPAQQRHEQRARQTTGIRRNPERPLGTDRRGGADPLALARDCHHRGLSLGPPGRAVHRIGPKARLVPEIDLGLVLLGAARNRWIRLTLPPLNGCGIALVGTL